MSGTQIAQRIDKALEQLEKKLADSSKEVAHNTVTERLVEELNAQIMALETLIKQQEQHGAS